MKIDSNTERITISDRRYGYPGSCSDCHSYRFDIPLKLSVAPYFGGEDNSFKVMLVGQDPTIRKNSGRVKKVLMLDDPKSQLSIWLSTQVFDLTLYKSLNIYATNLVKCTFDQQPPISILKKCFQNCRKYITDEVLRYRPHLVLTLGNSSHEFFVDLLENKSDFTNTMQGDFSGVFKEGRLSTFRFRYSPCLHIHTFRVADVYGSRVKKFKTELKELLT